MPPTAAILHGIVTLCTILCALHTPSTTSYDYYDHHHDHHHNDFQSIDRKLDTFCAQSRTRSSLVESIVSPASATCGLEGSKSSLPVKKPPGMQSLAEDSFSTSPVCSSSSPSGEHLQRSTPPSCTARTSSSTTPTNITFTSTSRSSREDFMQHSALPDHDFLAQIMGTMRVIMTYHVQRVNTGGPRGSFSSSSSSTSSLTSSSSFTSSLKPSLGPMSTSSSTSSPTNTSTSSSKAVTLPLPLS
mmetsp:Transcript_43180/g.97208  ORF Transcript_43180/g.97208 Transcript_43180/m.97208 type:complete len:244 (-) Transcript_43180:247-978(-)